MGMGTPELEAQNSLFRGGVVELDWQGERLVETEHIPLPDGMNVFGFTLADAFNDGRSLVIGFDDKKPSHGPRRHRTPGV